MKSSHVGVVSPVFHAWVVRWKNMMCSLYCCHFAFQLREIFKRKEESEVNLKDLILALTQETAEKNERIKRFGALTLVCLKEISEVIQLLFGW